MSSLSVQAPRLRSERLTFERVMELFVLCGDQAPESFFRSMPGLTQDERAIIYFLRVVFSGSYKTIESYTRNLCRFITYLDTIGAPSLALVSPEVISNYVSHLKKQNLKVSSINTYMATIKSFYGLMLDLGMIQGDPAKIFKLRLQKETDKLSKTVHGRLTGHTTKTLSMIEVDRLLEETVVKAGIRDSVLVLFLYYTGVRAVELTRLCWQDVYETGDDGWFARIEGKGGKEREVYLPYHLVEQLMMLRRRDFLVPFFAPAPGIGHFPIFSKHGKRHESLSYDAIYKIVKKWGREIAKDKVSPHWLRHTHATHLFKKGATESQIQRGLGHASMTTTQKYIHARNRDNPAGRLFES